MEEATPSSPPSLATSVSELSVQFAQSKRPRSPPLAFEPTPNDALAPRISPHGGSSDSPSQGITSPPPHSSDMAPPPPANDARDLQSIINQQAMALKLAHQAFAAERLSWDLERDKLFSRITSLEQLLRVGGGYSPAKSPVLSPSHSGSVLTSPQAKAATSRLPSIAEDDNVQSLSSRREGAPQSIDIPRSSNADQYHRRRSVEFAESSPTSVKVEEIPIAPRPSMAGLSPPPHNFRMEAGHTPLKRPATPPPDTGMSMDGIEDTPTRNNTHINTYLVKDDEGDGELKGPLNMPELPHVPSEGNFTFDMLSQRLQQIEQHPEDITARPMVFAQPSPGLASPAEPDHFSPKTAALSSARRTSEGPGAAPPTRIFGPQDYSNSDVPSNSLSPTHLPALSKQTSQDQDDKLQAEFENGGIKLKKKASVNFGAPFGQLGGFGGRKQS